MAELKYRPYAKKKSFQNLKVEDIVGPLESSPLMKIRQEAKQRASNQNLKTQKNKPNLVVNVKNFKGKMIGEGVTFHEPIKKETAVAAFKAIYGPKRPKQHGLPNIKGNNQKAMKSFANVNHDLLEIDDHRKSITYSKEKSKT